MGVNEARIDRRSAELLEQHQANREKLRQALVACHKAIADLSFPLRWPVRGWDRNDVLDYIASLTPCEDNAPGLDELIERATELAMNEEGG